jgi:hypothetical protein
MLTPYAHTRKYRTTHNKLRAALKPIPRDRLDAAIAAAARRFYWQAVIIDAIGLALFIGGWLIVWSATP